MIADLADTCRQHPAAARRNGPLDQPVGFFVHFAHQFLEHGGVDLVILEGFGGSQYQAEFIEHGGSRGKILEGVHCLQGKLMLAQPSFAAVMRADEQDGLIAVGQHAFADLAENQFGVEAVVDPQLPDNRLVLLGLAQRVGDLADQRMGRRKPDIEQFGKPAA